MEIVRTILIIIAVIAFWGTPIFFGIRTAKKKNLSPNWMWFGIHPFFGWIAFAILAGSKPKNACPNCGEILKAHAKVCAYCNTPFDETTIPHETNTPAPLKKKFPLIGVLSGIGAFLLFIFLIWTIITKAFTNSWAYQNALMIAENNTELVKLIGEPIIQKGFMSGSINTSGYSGTADLIIPIKGSHGIGALSIYAVKEDGEWEMINLVFVNKEKTETIRLVE